MEEAAKRNGLDSVVLGQDGVRMVALKAAESSD